MKEALVATFTTQGGSQPFAFESVRVSGVEIDFKDTPLVFWGYQEVVIRTKGTLIELVVRDLGSSP